MKPLSGRHSTRIVSVWLGLILSIALGGCAVGGKSMSIDSTSKMPWFGLELKGRKPKSDGPQFRSVKSDQGDKSRIATAGLLGLTTGTKAADTGSSLPKKSSTALPTTDQSLVLDSTHQGPAEVDFR